MHTIRHCWLPFSTREVLENISSPLRVCLTPWSVFQDGRRHPISSAKNGAHKKEGARCKQCSQLYSCSLDRNLCFCTCCPFRAKVGMRIMLGGRFWPIKWRYVRCRCHDFRFYVTLFPKCFSNFRSRYLFAIGLPTLYLTLADTYLPIHTALPSSATRLVQYNEALGFWLNGLTPSMAQYSHEGLCSAMGLLCALNFAKPAPATILLECHRSDCSDSASSWIPLRSPLTEGITVVFFSSAE